MGGQVTNGIQNCPSSVKRSQIASTSATLPKSTIMHVMPVMPVTEMFDPNRTIQDNIHYYAVDATSFMKAIENRTANKVYTTSSQKAKILIALWIASQRVGTKKSFDDAWGMFAMSTGDIFKFVDMFDAPREARALRAKVKKWTESRHYSDDELGQSQEVTEDGDENQRVRIRST